MIAAILQSAKKFEMVVILYFIIDYFVEKAIYKSHNLFLL